MRKYAAIALSIPLAFLAFSCTSAPTVSEAQQKLCTSLAGLKTSLAALKSLSPNSKVSDLKRANEAVEKSWANVTSAAQVYKEAKADALDSAYQGLNKAIKSIPNNATLAQAQQSLVGPIAAVEAAQEQLNSTLKCP
jgi:hypothetical protein